jgi:hypothetical protein
MYDVTALAELADDDSIELPPGASSRRRAPSSRGFSVQWRKGCQGKGAMLPKGHPLGSQSGRLFRGHRDTLDVSHDDTDRSVVVRAWGRLTRPLPGSTCGILGASHDIAVMELPSWLEPGWASVKQRFARLDLWRLSLDLHGP